MSRFYTIVVTPAPTAAQPNQNPAQTWTSFPGGKNDPGALNVELDLFTTVYAVPSSSNASTITIWGISLKDIQQAPNYAGMQITVSGGMQAGLPLANPKQAGIILQGEILQSFANFVGTEMTLDFVVSGSGYNVSNPGNIVLNWPVGTPLSQVLPITFNTAFQGLKKQISIGSEYVLSHPVLAFYPTLHKLAQFILSITSSIKPPGVHITINPDGTILATDFSVQPVVKTLAFTDLIGQPTWIDANTMTFATVMRADVQVGTQILMPPELQNVPGIVATAAASQGGAQLKYQSAFKGKFNITEIRQIGNFRDANGGAWATIFRAYPAVSGVPVFGA